MEFCPKCKTLMLPTKKTAICPKCKSRVKADKTDIVIKEKISHEAERIPKKAPMEIEGTLPISDADCPKCGNKKAYWWVQQTRGGSEEDEVDTQFLRCTKCNHTWRTTV